jgi:competence protein ComEA
VTAERIIEFRETKGPFKKIEDIMNVPRIGPKMFEQIKDKITVD